MIKNIVQTAGIVFLLVLVCVVTIATFYMSYILGIGILLLSLGTVVYYLVNMFNNPTLHKPQASPKQE